MNTRLKNRLMLIFSIAITIQSFFTNTQSQTVVDPDVTEIEKQQKIAEAKKAIAEAKKAEFDALFPKPDVSSLVGGTKINDGIFIETQILGFCAMKSAAKEVTGRINGLSNKANLVVYSEADVKMLARYTLMMNRLKNIENGYDAQYASLLTAIQNVDSNFLVPDSFTIQSTLKEASRQNAAGLIIDTALKFLSLLKTDIEITPSEIAIGEKELVAEVFSNLNNGFQLYYPQTIPLSIQDCSAGTLETCSPLLNQIMKGSEAHDKVAFLKLKAKEILDDVQSNERAAKNITDLQAEIGALDSIINNSATKKKEREAKQKEKDGKLALIALATQGIRERKGKYTDSDRMSSFKDGYGVFAGKIEILDKIFKVTLNELGFSKEPEAPTPAASKTATATPTSCMGKDCPQTTSQTTNVNVKVGDEEDEEAAGSGGGGGGDKTFASYLQAESLKKVISQSYSRWLEVKIIKAGGNMRVKSNIFTNLAVGSRVNFSGGAIIYFNVFNNQGKSEKAGVVSAYNSYQKSSNIIGACDQGQTTKQRRKGRL